MDPWENPYVVRTPGEINVDFDIVSYGADGQPGGEGEDADITN
jgi:general secretion pathway protein G